MPNIPNSLQLHAAANVSAATPPVVTGAVNTTGVARSGVGIWVITLATEIDQLDRKVVLTPEAAAADVAIVKIDPDVQTDSTIGVLGFDTLAAPVLADIAWEFLVYRVAIFL